MGDNGCSKVHSGTIPLFSTQRSARLNPHLGLRHSLLIFHNTYNHCSTGFTVSAIPAVASGTVVLVQHSQCYMLCMCSTVGVMATATSSSHELRHLFHPNSCCSLWGCEYPFKYHNKILDEPLYICYCGYDMTCVPAYDIQLLNLYSYLSTCEYPSGYCNNVWTSHCTCKQIPPAYSTWY